METFALPVREPVLMQGAGKGIWVADGASQTLNCFHPDNGRTVGLISLPGEPVGLGAAGKMLVVSLASGAIIAFDEESGQKLWNDAVGSAAWVKGSARLIWVAEKNGGPLIAFDRSGRVTTVPADGLTLFAANDNGVVWISRGGVLVWSPLDGTTPLSVPLPSAPMAGEMVHCASAIWASVPDGLLLIDHVSLQVRSVIAAPEGPARHILCVDGKLAFGTQTVYVLNPMADAGVRVLGVRPGSPLRGLAATPSKIWALESATPLVHIADFY